MLSAIPAAHRDAAEAALAAAFGRGRVIEESQALRGGQSGALVFRLRIGGHDYVLRQETVAHPMSDPATHFACMAAAAAAGLAPALHYADAASGVAVLDYVAPHPPSAYPGSREDLIAEAGARLRTLQALPGFPAAPRGHLDAAEAFIADFEATGFISPDAIGEHLFRFRQIHEVWPADSTARAGHNDLNPGNVLCDGKRLWFVDWAVASANDMYGDPACLANTLGLRPEEEAALLGVWLGREADAREAARFRLMRRVWPMVQAVLILKGVADARPDLASPAPFLLARSLSAVHADIGAGRLDMATPEGRLDYGKALLDELLANMRDPRFGRAIQVLAG